jgi:hypothetical protein
MEGTQVREQTQPFRNHAPRYREMNAKRCELQRSQRGALRALSYEEPVLRGIAHKHIYGTL